MDLGSRVKMLRRQLDLTQSKFGERIGMKQNSIALIESGGRNISSQAILAICREFNVNENWLRTGEGEMFAPSSSATLDALAAEYDLNGMERTLIEKYLNLKESARAEVLDYVTKIAEALTAEEAPEAPEPPEDLDSLSIDEKVALYRSELEREKKAEEKSGA